MATKNKKLRPNSKEKEHLLTLIFHTEKNIKNDGSGLDELWINQAKRIKKRLEKVK